jgi:hypothetical protein
MPGVGEMIWVLLAALGVPIWLIVGGRFSALWNRRRFVERPTRSRANVGRCRPGMEPATGVVGRRAHGGSTTS